MNTKIQTLGECTIDSPLLRKYPDDENAFTADSDGVLYDCHLNQADNNDSPAAFELAGPRKKIYFSPAYIRVAIVTCGGLCPGLNDVIRSIVMESYYRYEVQSIIGIRYGYNGLIPANNYEPIELTPDRVGDIHREGGTILGSSRGGSDDVGLLVDTLQKMGISVLYTIGGDGTLRGAHDIAKEVDRRGLKISIIGIPKTIDNDISYIQRTFGFESAVQFAVEAISGAHVEATGAPNGVGIVKLMGRHSGFIAANAALAMNDANYLLVPEEDFDLHGPNGLLHHLEKRLEKRDHAVICIAEGAGQDMVGMDENNKDASGNILLGDIGLYIKDQISKYFKAKKKTVNIKYIDPSYLIRSAPANANDSIFCNMLGQYAVHAGMAGKTDMIVGLWSNLYTHVPIELVTSKRKQIDTKSRFWHNILAATGQPINMKNKKNPVITKPDGPRQ